MTREQVREIAIEVVRDTDATLARLVPTVTTKQACIELSCDKKWLYKNKHLFNAIRVNRRGDLRFSTIKIVGYKRSML